MISINQAIIGGNLTREPQLKQVGNSCVATFGLAINSKYKGSDGELKEEVTFVEVEAWNRQAELIAQYLTKGSSCVIEGKLKFSKWEKDGRKYNQLSIKAIKVHFVGIPESNPDPQYRDMSTQKDNPVDDSEPPF